MTKIAIYPGTFDPLTWGHVDIAARATQLFDRVIVGISTQASKTTRFSLPERVELARIALQAWPSIEVHSFEGLTVDFARQHQAQAIVRGIRDSNDMSFEMQLAHTNRILSPTLETVFLTPSAPFAHISSTLVRDIARLGGDIAAFVPECVVSAFQRA